VRATAAIEARLGYSTPVVDYALDRLFFGLTAASLEAAIVSELGSLDALDAVTARKGAPAAWARGVERTVIVSSNTTIGVALVPAVFALCAKSDVTVKDRSDALIASFFATLAEEHPAFASSARATVWDGGADADEAKLLHDADVVVAFGGDDALRAIRAQCGIETRFVPFGHRASIGRLSATASRDLDDARADAIARDALLYDGEGCLSLHLLFVTAHGDELDALTAKLAHASERVAIEFPAGDRPMQRDAGAAAYRSLARFRSVVGGSATMQAGAAMVVVAPPRDAPPFVPGVLATVAIDRDDDVVDYVRDHRLPVQALGVDTVDSEALALGERIRAVRVCLLGTMQDPPVAGHHGGEGRIAPFVRWVDAQ
jgi:hypothetical protein